MGLLLENSNLASCEHAQGSEDAAAAARGQGSHPTHVHFGKFTDNGRSKAASSEMAGRGRRLWGGPAGAGLHSAF